MKNIVVVIMAGGLGKRMESSLPKVLHKISGIPMICHLLLKLKVLKHIVKIVKIIIVVGKYKDIIKSELEKYDQMPEIEYVIQDEPLGTGHAIKCCINELSGFPESDVLILSGDVPLLKLNTMNKLISMNEKVKLITTILSEPTGYGRIVKNSEKFEKIVEQKDCSKRELEVKEVNCGIYAIKSEYLCKYLPHLKNNNSQGEYYLTDIIEMIKREEIVDVGLLKIPEENVYEILGVNTVQQLKELEKLIIKNKIETKNICENNDIEIK
jgi:UDP-N-acetylglucosamine diphosphorylase/glucosamine-1-phosphate N-acetyltransferase